MSDQDITSVLRLEYAYDSWPAKAADEIDRLRVELERERMRLAACGVVAISDTPESATKARDMHPDYHSASCDDVARRVDECIALRARVAQLEASNQKMMDRLIPITEYVDGTAVGYGEDEIDRLFQQVQNVHAAYCHSQQQFLDASSESSALRARVAQLESALGKLNEIRECIIATQTVNWSEHVYPFVAVLDELGFKGRPYPELVAYYGPLIKRAETAEARVVQLEAALQSIAANTCCDKCQEAATVARAALETKP